MFDPSIASMAPGPQLAAALAGCDLAELDADETLTWLAGWQRMAGWVEAASVHGVAHFADLRAPVPPGANSSTRLPVGSGPYALVGRAPRK